MDNLTAASGKPTPGPACPSQSGRDLAILRLQQNPERNLMRLAALVAAALLLPASATAQETPNAFTGARILTITGVVIEGELVSDRSR